MEWSNGFEDMTLEQAKFVRFLRIEAEDVSSLWGTFTGYTWRGVAQKCNDEWDGDWGQNQIAGMEICEQAAKMFGEDYKKEPWN